MRRAVLLMLVLYGCAPSATPDPTPEFPGALPVESVYPVLLRLVGADSTKREFVVSPGATAFDRSAAAALERSPMRIPVSDSTHALQIGTRGVRYAADTAFVRVEYGRCEEREEELSWWQNTDELVFVGRAGGWRLIAIRSIRNVDGGCS